MVIDQAMLFFIYYLVLEGQFVRSVVHVEGLVGQAQLLEQFLLKTLIFVKIKPKVILELEVLFRFHRGCALGVVYNGIVKSVRNGVIVDLKL